jgi:hypothetical protein
MARPNWLPRWPPRRSRRRQREADLDRDGRPCGLARLANDLATLTAPWRGDVNDDLYVNSGDLFALAERLLAAAGKPTGEAEIRALVNGAILLEPEPEEVAPATTGETALPLASPPPAPAGTAENALPGGAK